MTEIGDDMSDQDLIRAGALTPEELKDLADDAELHTDDFAEDDADYPVDFVDGREWDDGRWDDDPNPYHGTYSED